MATQILSNLKYTDDHEWALIEGDTITVGITDFAQSQLGDIVFVELPEVGTELTKGGAFGVVESIKSVSDLFSPVTGSVLEANQTLADAPESLNESPYESWMLKIKLSNPEELNSLLNSDTYEGLCNE
jgi:glycine cleavage system H protein